MHTKLLAMIYRKQTMVIYEIRMQNYHILRAQQLAIDQGAGKPVRGALRRFAENTGLPPAYLSHVKTGRKNIGDDMARKLEAVFNKPSCWLDTSHSADNAESACSSRDKRSEFAEKIAELAASVARLYPEETQQLLSAMLAKKLIDQVKSGQVRRVPQTKWLEKIWGARRCPS